MVEVDLVLETIFKLGGLDLRQYAKTSVLRQIQEHCEQLSLNSICDLIPRIIADDGQLETLIDALVVKTSHFYRDPECYRLMVDEVFPVLADKDEVRIWIAGCGGGQEILSLAILLHENYLLDKATIYATDINALALREAEKCAVAETYKCEFVSGYQEAGGQLRPEDYFIIDQGWMMFPTDLMANVQLVQHDVIHDDPMDHIDMVICRNVLMYYNRTLRNRALQQMKNALIPRGYICLGSRESLSQSPLDDEFEPLKKQYRLFRQMAPDADHPVLRVTRRQNQIRTVTHAPAQLGLPKPIE